MERLRKFAKCDDRSPGVRFAFAGAQQAEDAAMASDNVKPVQRFRKPLTQEGPKN